MRINFRMWWFALQKPVTMSEKHGWDALDPVAQWIIATRGTVTQLTLFSGVIAGLLAWRDGYFDWLLWLVMTLGVYFAHSSENMINDYIDYTRGVDEDNYYRALYGIHPLVHKFWTKKEWSRWVLFAGGLAVSAGVFTLIYTSFSPYVFGLFLFGAIMIPFYAWPLKYWGLGEILIYLNWGLVLIPGIYTVLAGTITPNLLNVALAGMAFGFGFGSFNLGKHIDKVEGDRMKGVRSLPVRIGERAARSLNIITIILPYLMILYLVFGARYFTPVVLIVFLAVGRAWKVIELLRRPRPAEPPPGFQLWPRWFSTPQLRHIRLFGGLYILSLIADLILRAWIPGVWQ